MARYEQAVTSGCSRERVPIERAVSRCSRAVTPAPDSGLDHQTVCPRFFSTDVWTGQHNLSAYKSGSGDLRQSGFGSWNRARIQGDEFFLSQSRRGEPLLLIQGVAAKATRALPRRGDHFFSGSTLSVTRMRWYPNCVFTGPWITPTGPLNTASLNSFTICPGLNVPRLPPLLLDGHSL